MVRYALALCCLAVIGCQKLKYPSAADTVRSFQDGRFQIVRIWEGPQKPKHPVLVLIDKETHTTIVKSVYDWQYDGNLVCTCSEDKEYAVINCTTGEVFQFEDLASVPPQYGELASKVKRPQ